MDPVDGIPGVVSRPNLADMRKHLDGWHAEECRRRALEAKFLPKPASSAEPATNPEMQKRIRDGLRQLSEQLKSGLGPSVI